MKRRRKTLKRPANGNSNSHSHSHSHSGTKMSQLQVKLVSISSAFTWTTSTLLVVALIIVGGGGQSGGQQVASSSSGGPSSQLQFEPERNSYTGLTFTFDPRLDKRVEWLHFDHWLSIVQHTSSLLYESLNGRAHLAEVRVLIPYKWRQFEWPVLHKPGSPIMVNRRLRFADSDVLVGFEDPNYKETPFAVQHDECGQKVTTFECAKWKKCSLFSIAASELNSRTCAPSSGRCLTAMIKFKLASGLNIRMPISFLEETTIAANQTPGSQSVDVRLKGRQLAREFASHRYGIFKESGFRSDPMYPPFSSLAGLAHSTFAARSWASAPASTSNGSQGGGGANQSAWQLDEQQQLIESNQLRGFDEAWNECPFETNPSSGLPSNAQCLPYLTAANLQQQQPARLGASSFNLMSSDPFSYLEVAGKSAAPMSWRQLSAAGDVKWHFCGQNFHHSHQQQQSTHQLDGSSVENSNQLKQQPAPSNSNSNSNNNNNVWFEHNERAANKQNKMCQERSALDVIRSSDDFRRLHSSRPSNFNRLPAPRFKFLQEMPPRVMLAFEYTAHLFQSRRLDHALLESAVNKYLALDLIADSEVASLVFGQHSSHPGHFQRLDASSPISARFSQGFNPAFDPYDETVQMYSAAELAAMDVHSAALGQQPRIIKGTCSLARLLAEVNSLIAKGASQYDDMGADLIVITGGLFVEDEQRVEELLRASQLKAENNRLNIIIYPSTMLFDTKSRDGFVVLDSLDSEQIIRSRLGKLLLIQRLTGAHIHLVKEHLDSNGDVKLASTLIQFHQIFEHISKGHSWDQTQSMQMLDHKTIDSRPVQQPAPTSAANQSLASSKLTYHFEVDSSIQNELFVGFIDPKQSSLHATRLGKRFSLKSLQLRSPGGQLIFTETSTWTGANAGQANQTAPASDGQQPEGVSSLNNQQAAFFPYRAQLSWAAFHVTGAHLQQLNATNRLAGTWTLSAISEEPIQTSALALAKVNPSGDTVTANCWVQAYYSSAGAEQEEAPASGQHLKAVKVFAQVRGRLAEVSGRMEVQDQLGNIVQNVNMLDDGLGSPDMTKGDGILSQFVQRAHRPGFYKVLIELTGPPAAGQSRPAKQSASHTNSGQDNACCGSFIPKRDQPDSRHLSRRLYCGTFHVDALNRLAEQRPPRVNNLTVINVDQDQRRVTIRWFEPQLDIAVHSAQLAATNKPANSQQLVEGAFNDLLADESSQQQQEALANNNNNNNNKEDLTGKRRRESSRRHAHLDDDDDDDVQITSNDETIDRLVASSNQRQQARGIIMQTGGGRPSLSAAGQADEQQPQPANLLASNRYEIKMFTDREMLKRTFDAKQEVGFKFNEWNVEGQFPNASAYGGMKEVTLRIPAGREGLHFIAMKVYNNVGLGSQISNIVQFYMRTNVSLDESESIYGQVATIDAEGNMYDKNGYLLQRGGSLSPGANSNQLNYSLLRGASNLDGLSVLILFSLLAFLISVVCIFLVACLASSARKSLISSAKLKKATKSTRSNQADDEKAINSHSGSLMTGAGSGSSVASSSNGADSGQTSEVASSLCGGSQGAGASGGLGHELDIGKLGGLVGVDELNYSNLREQHQQQLNQAQLIHSQHQLISANQQQQQQQQQQFANNYYQQQHNFETEKQQMARLAAGGLQHDLQHTIVNGYTYATVGGTRPQQHHLQGDLNENGLALDEANMSPIQSWPADILLSHYDKVKQARERNEAPPVMRFESVQDQSYLSAAAAAARLNDSQPAQIGLPEMPETTTGYFGDQDANNNNSNSNYLARQQRLHQQAGGNGNYQFNQQLQQQLSSVLKSKNKRRKGDSGLREKSSPALEGVTGEFEASNNNGANYNNDIYGAPMQQQQQQPIGLPVAVQPPPQYIYSSSAADGAHQVDEACGLASHLTDPSIYSQSTNLQQVADNNNYYANQHNLWQQQQPIYGSSSMEQQQTFSGTTTTTTTDEMINYDKSNSAISEV